MSGDAPGGGQRVVLRNIGVLGLAQAATMALNLVALVVIARTVGEVWFGVLQWGVAFSAYALIVAEWGLGTLAVREVSRLDGPAAVHRYAATHLGLMVGLGGLVLLLGAAVLPLFPIARTDPAVALVYLGTIVPFALSLDWVGIGLERLGTVSLVKTLRSLLYAAAALALLPRLAAATDTASWPAARWVPVFFWLAWLLAAAVMAWRVRRWLGRWVWPRAGPRREWWRRLRASGPIGAGAVTLRVLLNVDVVLLGVLASPAAVGNYAAAAKVVFVLTIAVEVVWKALLPRLARAWHRSPDLCRRRFSLYLGLVLVGLVPLAVGGALLGDELMRWLYGDRFASAGPVCRVLSVSYVALAVGQFFGNGLIATDRQRRALPPLLAGAVVAVGAVATLAPTGGGPATAVGMLLAHGTLLVVSAWVGRELVAPLLWRPVAVAAVAAAAMALAVLAWPQGALPGRIALGAAVYLAVAAPALLGWLRGQVRTVGL